MNLEVTSTAFEGGQDIPAEYTADGEDKSPSIWWSNVPENAEQLVLICDDPDAPRDKPWVHWVLYGVSALLDGMPEGLPAEGELSFPPGARQGRNDFGNLGYGGPAPPRGHGTHHYHFHLYAVDTELDLGPGATKEEVLEAIEGHVVGQGEIIGTYER